LVTSSFAVSNSIANVITPHSITTRQMRTPLPSSPIESGVTMSDYLFIQSQDPFTEVRTEHQFALAGQLYDAGHNVRLHWYKTG